MKIFKIILLGMGHFLVDLQGIYLIQSQYQHHDFLNIALFFIIYNIIAFGLQPFFGYIADKHRYYFIYIILGLLLPLLALQMASVGIIAIIISTLGNAMYHVGGGIVSVDLYPKKAAPAGVFVAPGALGVFLGGYLAVQTQSYIFIISVVTIVICCILFYSLRNHQMNDYFKPIKDNIIKIVCMIFGVVFIRGMIGSILIFTWKTDYSIIFILVSSVFLGKLLGGVLGDKFGFKLIGIGGLVLSLPLLLLGHSNVILGLLGAFCFNLTMAITLFLIIDNLGKYKGFAFGLTTLALLFSYFPSAFGFSLDFGIMYYIIMTLLVLSGAYLLNKSIDAKQS